MESFLGNALGICKCDARLPHEQGVLERRHARRRCVEGRVEMDDWLELSSYYAESEVEQGDIR